MEWILDHIPTWWWIGLVIFMFVARSAGFLLAGLGYIAISFGILCLYGLWLMSFGWFFDSPMDMPWWLWVFCLLACIPAAGPTMYILIIKK